jgi:cytochrome oxidase Cu insertion factor (SCO1/SenC/PrrC family)
MSDSDRTGMVPEESGNPPSVTPPVSTARQSYSWRQGRLLRAAIVTLLAAPVAVAAGWAFARYTKPPALAGAVVTPPIQAPDFRLHDQHGATVSMSAYRGKVVALTFLYTHCPDACPLIAEMMHKAHQRLGDGARRVALVAVSVDPRGDTPEAVRTFLATHHVEGELTYLTGSFAELKAVWSGYFVGTEARDFAPKAASKAPGSPELVGHSAFVYMIDPRGEIRAILPSNFDPNDLVADVRILASGR